MLGNLRISKRWHWYPPLEFFWQDHRQRTKTTQELALSCFQGISTRYLSRCLF